MPIPQAINHLNILFCWLLSSTAAMDNAPNVDRGLTSTICDPTATAIINGTIELIAIFEANPGIKGINAGNTTPEEEYHYMKLLKDQYKSI